LVVLTTADIQWIISILVVAVPVSIYIAKLHWKINYLQKLFDNHPLLVMFKTWEQNQGGIDFLNSILKSKEVAKTDGH
jgi:hypothetical protein